MERWDDLEECKISKDILWIVNVMKLKYFCVVHRTSSEMFRLFVVVARRSSKIVAFDAGYLEICENWFNFSTWRSSRYYERNLNDAKMKY